MEDELQPVTPARQEMDQNLDQDPSEAEAVEVEALTVEQTADGAPFSVAPVESGPQISDLRQAVEQEETFGVGTAEVPISENLAPKTPMTGLIVSLMAIVLAAAALTICLRLRAKIKEMASALRHMPPEPVSDYGEMIALLRKYEVAPAQMTQAQQGEMWGLLRTLLTKFDLESDRSETSRMDEPNPVFPDEVRTHPTASVSPGGVNYTPDPTQSHAIIKPVQSSASSDHKAQHIRDPGASGFAVNPAEPPVEPRPLPGHQDHSMAQARLRKRGMKGIESIRSKFELNEFVNENNAVFYMFDEQENLVTSNTRIPRSKQWFFTIEDKDTGLFGLLIGPAVSQNAERLASDGHKYATLFKTWFDVDLQGQNPRLIDPALVRPVGQGLSVVQRGRLTI